MGNLNRGCKRAWPKFIFFFAPGSEVPRVPSSYTAPTALCKYLRENDYHSHWQCYRILRRKNVKFHPPNLNRLGDNKTTFYLQAQCSVNRKIRKYSVKQTWIMSSSIERGWFRPVVYCRVNVDCLPLAYFAFELKVWNDSRCWTWL